MAQEGIVTWKEEKAGSGLSDRDRLDEDQWKK